MKKILMILALAVASATPLAASAHTDVRVGINLGAPSYSYRVPAYYDYGTVTTVRPYCPPQRVDYDDYYYYGRPYTRVEYREPVVIYREYDGYRGHREYERREWRGHGWRR